MKRKKNQKKPIAIIILIILLGFIALYASKKLVSNQNITLDSTITFDKESEIMSLNNQLETIRTSLSIITILTSIDKYNAGGEYLTKKGQNLLETVEAKQLFIMEQLIKNQENYQNFIFLNNNGEEDFQINSPTDETTVAYYPYNLFIEEYNKYFNESFDLEKRTISYQQNKYDLNEEYIYYNNRRAGLNGLTIETIDINNIIKKSPNEYQANITLNYSKRLATMLGLEKEEATLNYIKDQTKIKLIDYQLK